MINENGLKIDKIICVKEVQLCNCESEIESRF